MLYNIFINNFITCYSKDFKKSSTNYNDLILIQKTQSNEVSEKFKKNTLKYNINFANYFNKNITKKKILISKNYQPKINTHRSMSKGPTARKKKSITQLSIKKNNMTLMLFFSDLGVLKNINLLKNLLISYNNTKTKSILLKKKQKKIIL